jgi:2-isopropylmalate synthase
LGPGIARGAVDHVVVYDTTLRDGMQGEGMSLSVEEKVRVARILDELGVPMIEAGFPTSNPKELELFELLRDAGLSADVCAFGMTRRRGIPAEEDEALRVLAESWTPVSTLVGKTWGLHLEKVVRVDREENLRMIQESVAFLVASGKRVIYDAEHFFDAYRDDSAYAIECLRAALDGGAENLTMCDTNGASLPHAVAEAVHIVRRALPEAALGIHTHNDAEVAVANTLAAVAEGADRGFAHGRRHAQPPAGPEPGLRGTQRVRAQGRDARGRRQRGSEYVRAHRPRRGRQLARGAGERAVRQGHGHRPRRRRPR